MMNQHNNTRNAPVSTNNKKRKVPFAQGPATSKQPCSSRDMTPKKRLAALKLDFKNRDEVAQLMLEEMKRNARYYEYIERLKTKHTEQHKKLQIVERDVDKKQAREDSLERKLLLQGWEAQDQAESLRKENEELCAENKSMKQEAQELDEKLQEKDELIQSQKEQMKELRMMCALMAKPNGSKK